MPSIQRTKEILTQIWDILKVVSVLFLMTSTIISALVWFGVNVFYPNPIAVEMTKYFLLILIPSTISAIMLQAYRKSIEKKMETLNEGVMKIQEFDTKLKSLSGTTEQMQKNLQYYNDVFAVQCPNPNCRKPISIPIPYSLIKEIHYVDGRPMGKRFVGREIQVTCQHCNEVFHIVYP